MSFLQALEHDVIIVGKDLLAIAPIAGTVIGFINPPLGAVILNVSGRVTSLVLQAEQAHKDAGKGALKSQEVFAGFDNILAAVEEVTGKKYTYDKAALQSEIDATVALFNAKAAFKATMRPQ